MKKLRQKRGLFMLKFFCRAFDRHCVLTMKQACTWVCLNPNRSGVFMVITPAPTIALTKSMIALALCCLAGATTAQAEGKDPVSDRSFTTQKLENLSKVALVARPMVTVYEVTSNVSEIDVRAATAMFTTALIKSKQFRVLERNKIANGVAREREMNQTGVTSGTSSTKQIKGANVIFEATFSEATAGKSSSAGGFSIGGLQIGGGNSKDEVGLDVRVLSVGSGEVLDAINVRKEVASSQSSVSGIGALVETIAANKGHDLQGMTPDANIQSARKEGMDRALRALIEQAIFELAQRAGEWVDE
jgi:curli biogenesis system outer membrane secretion channel CsgG